MKMTFTKKVVLITGAASGIGKAIAINFAELNAELALVDLNESGLEDTGRLCKRVSKLQPLLITADLSKMKDIEKIIELTIKQYSKLDVLISNAGICELGTVTSTAPETFERIFNINVRAGFFLTSLAVPHLIKSKGKIVYTSSLAGNTNNEKAVVYCMSKSAVDQMTRSVATELAKHGVRVNSVNPGVINTNIFPRNVKEITVASWSKLCPLGRPGEPEEVAKAIIFLSSDDSSFITGINCRLDGGGLNP